VAIVGPSGSGKSTLMKLIQGLYLPNHGRITVDGHDLRTIQHAALRRRIGALPQEVFLFSGTIHDNIALTDPDVPMSRVIDVAKLAGAHEFICNTGLGYETKVGERGQSLSGGQRQRIALARALLHDPDILLLDEPTSALDGRAERTIQRNLSTAYETKTVLIIAHRLSTVRDADRILVMDKGRIIDQGTHNELLKRGGLYAELVGQQLSE
jgi:ABC-type multidrug transport system fused ATPase/permease subunit